MWSGTVGLVNGKHRYLTAETFGFKINSNGQQLKRRQQWTIEPFPEMTGPDGSISSAASVTSQPACPAAAGTAQVPPTATSGTAASQPDSKQLLDPNDACILTLSAGGPLVQSSLASASASSMRTSSSNESSSSNDQDGYGEEHENVALKSHLNKYLAVDSFGNVTCDSDEKTENARFTITICSMSQGRSKDEHIFWAFKNFERGYYLGTTDDGMICCNAKMPKSRAELWHLHLLPARGASFFALKSLGRKRFARVTSGAPGSHDVLINGAGVACANKQVQLDANISWGSETLFQFKYHEGGKYSLLSSDNRLLTNEGQCISWQAAGQLTGSGQGAANSKDSSNSHNIMQQPQQPPPECLFTLEYHSGYLAFRDSFGQYLAAAGRSSVLRSRSIGVSRDELFMFESVPVQVSIKATFNNRWVSIKQGVDLSANQTETTSRYETFQLTYHKQTHNWSIMTHDCNFWTISHNTSSSGNTGSMNGTSSSSSVTGSTVSVCRPGDYEGLTRGQFKLIWSDSDATFSLKYVDLSRQERWISARKSGQLFLGGASHEPVKFVMRFQNRRLLNLRPVDGSGFVGLKGSGAGANARQLEANKTAPDSILVEYPELSISEHGARLGATANGITSPGDNLVGPLTQAKLVSAKNGAAVESSPVGRLSSSSSSNEHQKVVNMFNVKLNNTKLGQSVFEKFNASASNGNQCRQQATASELANNATSGVSGAGQKEIDCGIDANNNTDDNLYMLERDCDSQKMNGAVERVGGGGGVESSSAPSVASIINSFSSAKISNTQQHQNQAASGCLGGNIEQQRIVGSSVSKLASSFEQPAGLAGSSNGFSKQPDHLMANGDTPAGGPLDTASVVSCSSGTSSASNGAPSTIIQATKDLNLSLGAGKSPLADQVAQSECCYLKALTNNKYLVIGDEIASAASTGAPDSASIICDATNRACAQAWILELRSHNSIAIRASDTNAYMQLGTNGTIHTARCDPKDASLWEF